MSCLAEVTRFILGDWGLEGDDGLGEVRGSVHLSPIRTRENRFLKVKENRACSWKQLEWILDDPKSTNVHYQSCPNLSFTLR